MRKIKALEDLKAAIENMENNIRLFENGAKAAYRVVAVQLRLLLCDKNALVKRLFPAARLHELRSPANVLPNLSDKLVFQMPLELEARGGKIIGSGLSINQEKIPLPIEDWLSQALMNSCVTIRELIKSVADKEGAHADPDYNDTLNFSNQVRLLDEKSQQQFIIAVGKYVLGVLKDAVKANNLW